MHFLAVVAKVVDMPACAIYEFMELPNLLSTAVALLCKLLKEHRVKFLKMLPIGMYIHIKKFFELTAIFLHNLVTRNRETSNTSNLFCTSESGFLYAISTKNDRKVFDLNIFCVCGLY